MQTQVPTKAPARGVGRKKIVLGLMMAAVGVLAFCWGRSGAQQPPSAPGKVVQPTPPPAQPTDYSRRVVAHIHGGIPITREELGEYLIARFGEERVENFVNRRIIEVACQRAGVTVSDAEVESSLKDDLKALNINEKDFKNKVLKAYGKSLYEWKEDVLRPKLMLTRLCRINVKVEDADLRAAFDAHYGPKVECKMILIPKGDNNRHDFDIYDKVRSSDAEFDWAARKQAFAPLAAKGGEFPIYRGYPEQAIEKEAFSLKPGEVSRLLTLPDGSRVILKCVRTIPADSKATLNNDERAKLHSEVTEARLTQMVPLYFKKLRDEAQPQIYIKRKVQYVDPGPAAQHPVAPQQGAVAAPPPQAPGILPVGGQKK